MDAVPLCEPWPVSGCADLGAFAPAVSGVGLMAASEILWARTGRQFGSCEVTVRPCARRCYEQPYGGWWWRSDHWVSGWPYGPVSGGFVAPGCGTCVGSCGCTSAAELVLDFEAQAIAEVKIDGVVLPASGYAFYDGDTLVRTDGGEWPFCQDWGAVSGVGVFEVAAVFGRPVPALGALAMGELVPEVLKACAGDAGCLLPSAVVASITRQGVSKTFTTSAAYQGTGLLGLPLADDFIETFNPHRLDSGMRIWNPDDVGSTRRPGGVV